MGWLLGMGRFIATTDPANLSSIDIYESPDGGDHRFDGVSPDTTCTSSCPSYTSDGSNLRLRRVSSTVREIDFPDGITKKFQSNASGRWDLREIRNSKNSDIVTITPSLGSTTGCAPGTDSFWTITDSHSRTHTVCFTNLPVNSVEQPLVDRVIFATPGTTATYQFHYAPTTLLKPNEDTDSTQSWRQTHDVQVLDSLTLPDGSTYRFTLGDGDVLGKITLPTLGTISYQYEGWRVPSTDFCKDTYGLGYGFGGSARGVKQRTFTPAVPAGQTAVSRTWQYARELRPGAGAPGYMSVTPCFVDITPGSPPLAMQAEMHDELVVTITDPNGHKTASHFSVWPGQDDGRSPDPDTSPAGFKRMHYSYPYGRYDAAQNRYLSQEIFDCTGSCTLQRSIWIRHELQPSILNDVPLPNRMASRRMVFHDDPAACVAEGAQATCARSSMDLTDWDGYGHYRQTATNVRFDNDAAKRIVTTAWNKVAGVPQTFTKTEPWVLDTYESVSTTENGITAVTQSCFDLTTGFLRGMRTLAGASPASTDLLVVYENANLNGNPSAEKFYGGDSYPIGQNQAVLCSALDALGAAAPPQYRIDHEWEHGLLARSKYSGMPFFSRDLTVDLHGLVRASRDPDGLETTYGYDSKWRLTSVTPPGQATTSYTYTNASGSGSTLTQPAKVVETTVSSTAGTVQREYQFDTFGLLWRQKELMPDGQWSLRETLYDKLGRTASVSEALSLQGITNEVTFDPPNKTSFLYDLFGRPTSVTLPDATSTSTAYKGSRTTTRTSTMASSTTAESAVSKREEYNALGRLVAVTENVGDPGELTTSYTYDVGGRLATVSMPSAAGTQTRLFTYDRRGLLSQEQHPEIGVNGNGTTTYASYDSRGHAGKKTVGSTIDLRFEFDAAERLIRIRDAKASNRDLALFAWDCIRFDVTQPCTTVTHRGQLAATARYNYDPELGTIAVTQGNGYHPTTGRLVRRDSAVGDGVVSGVTRFTGESFFFTQTHGDLGLLDTLTYPCRSAAGGCPGGDPARTIQHGYVNGALKSVGTYASNMTYRANGMIDTVTHGTGTAAVLEKWEADPNGMARPRRIYATNHSGTQELWSSGLYFFDGSGNIKKLANTSYTYDGFERLLSWQSIEGQSTETFKYIRDEYGNGLTEESMFCGPAGPGLFFCTSGAMAPPRTMRGTTNHYTDTAYDATGNVLLDDRAQRMYAWDPLGMMTSATVDGRTFRYVYSADNERIAAVERVPVGSTLRNRTTFTLRGEANQLLSTWTDDWTSGTRSFTQKEDTIWRNSQLLAVVQGTNTLHYTLDHLGSPRLITDASGTVLGVQKFGPFGDGGLYGSGALQFSGHERDRASLGGGVLYLPDYMHARYREIGSGRFASVDPGKDWDPAKPQSWNMYSYVRNNPMNATDPTGRCQKPVDGDCTDMTIVVTAKAPNLIEEMGSALSMAWATPEGRGEVPPPEPNGMVYAVMPVGVGPLKGPAFTRPTLPPKTLAAEGEVTIKHNYRSGDHGPAHAHVEGGGPTTRIGPKGMPILDDPPMTATQRAVYDANKSVVRRAINKIGRWLDYMGL
jgi:RHS repeat-associated protein